MTTTTSRWHAVHPSDYPHEQQALDLLRAHLPDSPPFRAWSNFEFIAEDGSINEIDALVVSSDRIYLVEIKHWAGRISGNQNSWLIRSPSGRERYEENPLLLANRKARKLKSLLERQQAFRNGRVPFIQAAVFLSSPQCELALDEIAAQHVYLRPDARHRGAHSIIDVIVGRATQAEGRAGISRDTERALARAMDQLGLRKRTRAATVGDYLLTGLIAENDRYQDWQATHQRVASDHKRIRIFPHAQRAAEAEKRERKDIATREYALLRDIRHDAILSPRQLTESDIGPALVYDFDPEAQRLDHLIDAATAAPGFDQRLELIRAIGEALAYAHSRNVYHRALSPWTIELQHDAQGRPRPVLRDWQSGIAGQDGTADTRMTMHLGQQAGVIDNPRSAIYASPEVVAGHGYDPVAIDIFSLGALTYALFGGRHPASSVEDMLDKCRRGPGLMMSEALDGAPDSLQVLVQAATDPNPADRPSDVREFLRMLDDVEEELTAPEPERGALPADARQGDMLTGGFKVLRRLGAGSTCHALAVESPEGQQGVLKVAKDPSFNERLRQEYDTLLDVPHPNIVKAFGIHEIDGLTAIFIEQAGHRTMGQRLREQGPLSLDLLERFGDELLAVLVHLEREGINHRDLKPENIGLGETRKRALTLKLFDFSLARAPAENIRAGTPPYLDPFLSLRQPPRWDLHAERFAAAMTLHEMATGTLPTWGSAGQDPASSDEDASLDVEKFDASVRDGLADFFRRALHRNSKQRFDNADLMHLAWKNLFRHIDQTTTTDDDSDGSTTLDFARVESLSRETPLSELGLSARELNAADRIGATTVGQLLSLPGIRFYRNRGIGQQITRRLRQVREALAGNLGQATAPDLPDDQPGAWSIDRLVKALESTKLEAGEADIVSHWLGLADASPTVQLDLPSQREVAEASGTSRAQVQAAIDRAAGKWAKNGWMTALRDEVAAFLQRRESVASVAEVASGLLSAHGSTTGDAERQRLAAAVLQAALEVEATRESARYVLYRGHTVPLVVSTEGQGGLQASTAERAGFAEALAAEAATLAAEDPLPSPRRAEQALMAIPTPAGDPPMTPERRLRLAQAAAPGVALSSRQELYPEGLSAERALRLGANTLLGARRLGVEQLHARIHSRFSKAERLPGRPALDRLLQQIDFPLQWHEAGDGLPAGYAMAQQASGATRHTSTLRRMTTAVHGDADSPEAREARAFDATVRRALDAGRVVLVTADLRRVEDAVPELSQQYDLAAISLDRLLIDALKAQTSQIGGDWRVVRQADAAVQSSADWRRLTALVERAMPAVVAQLRDDPRPLLLQHLGLLVRYGHTGVIQTLRDAASAGQRPARLLLLPGDSHQPPMLDGVVLPVITPADWTHLPRSWLENRHRAAPAPHRIRNLRVINARQLLADLQAQQRRLENDLRQQTEALPELKARLQAEYTAARDAGRTADTYNVWRDHQVTQSAVAWVLACTFVRFAEDTGLLPTPRLSGPGDALRRARDAFGEFVRQRPTDHERHYLESVFDGLAEFPALTGLFGRAHNPLFAMPPTYEAARDLLAFWQQTDPDSGELRHDFSDPELDTRFLGDLYQDLSEAARKRYALLQTPEFVEEFILDRTLEPAIKTFGLNGIRLIDPTCGSGHFLLGAFHRLLDHWQRSAPGLDARERVIKALARVYGVDLNPFAVAIARFRLLVAALQASGIRTLREAPGWAFNLTTGDSLLHGRRFDLLGADDLSQRYPHAYAAEDIDAINRILGQRYHAVVGNPPYITASDSALNALYRERYETCHRKFSLGVPFTERFFQLAETNGDAPAGYVGLITADSFMKREFGKKLIEDWFPRQDLTHLIHTSGAYIPGHGTPTVILLGRNRAPVADTVRAVLGIRGEPSTPEDPAHGLVWRSIVDLTDKPGEANEYISVSDMEREQLGKHPWSLRGGVVPDVLLAVQKAKGHILSDEVSEVGFTAITGEDEFFVTPRHILRRHVSEENLHHFVEGDMVRDWSISHASAVVFPASLSISAEESFMRFAWPYRTSLKSNLYFGKTKEERGLRWFDFVYWSDSKLEGVSISFSSVATHNHFAIEVGSKIFKQSAPVIKLLGNAVLEDRYGIAGILNSSVACFWMKQVFHNKGDSTDSQGARITGDPAFDTYDFTSTGLLQFPLPRDRPGNLAQMLDELCRDGNKVSLPEEVADSRYSRDVARRQWINGRARAIALQDELDWYCYRAYGLLDDDLTYAGAPPGIALGERAFEIVLARLIETRQSQSSWFERHGSTRITDVPAHWPADYRALVERRIALIESHPWIGLLERPEYKRRWNQPGWRELEQAALRGWLLDRLETPRYWPEPALQRIGDLAARAERDADFMAVAALLTGQPAFDLAALLRDLLDAESVPALKVLRYKPAGLRKRADWEHTWDQQRREDAIDAAVAAEDPCREGEAEADWQARIKPERDTRKLAEVGRLPAPPKYSSADFLKAGYWRLRGGLDVPKERCFTVPDPQAPGDWLHGWAGWSPAQRVRALAGAWIDGEQRSGVDPAQLLPMLIAIDEELPWVLQWHNAIDPDTDVRPGDYFRDWLDQQLNHHHWTRQTLADWQPPVTARRGRRPRAGS